MKRLALLLAMAGLFVAPAVQACPPLLSRQALQQLDPQEELGQYVMLRWLTCGAETTLPALPVLRAGLRLQALQRDGDGDEPAAAPDDEFAEMVVASLSVNPHAVIAGFFEEREDIDEDTPAYLRSLMAWQVSAQQKLRHFEQGVAPVIAFLRQQPLSPSIEQQLELILIAQEIRQGKIEQARTHLARVASAAALPQADTESAERLAQMKAVLAPVREHSLAADTQRWVIDKSTGRRLRMRCGTGAWMEAMYGLDYLRAEVLRRADADADAAIAELLQDDWREQIGGHGSRSGFLAELLRKRHPPAALKLAWDDALASIRNDDDKAGLSLFGNYLALPSAVLEGDVTAAGGARERPLTVDELAELVRQSALYRETYAASR
ncbi:hypothetical protein DFR29_111179 [Tahibacter aquaticus]|uniref:Uncharacterized protein n=1 Tax=Tahibacter aquaticus TaxID=520092 RepID=A0A4R6YSN6_9GAMM|nr:hypothetical protein [Tahibacter aquaticus]TDR41265.1 hypothetical protein DFR29_111179 [Tahibacter aquaticus]